MKNQYNSDYYEKVNWEEQNRVAIDDYNKRVKKEALFSDNFRSF